MKSDFSGILMRIMIALKYCVPDKASLGPPVPDKSNVRRKYIGHFDWLRAANCDLVLSQVNSSTHGAALIYADACYH